MCGEEQLTGMGRDRTLRGRREPELRPGCGLEPMGLASNATLSLWAVLGQVPGLCARASPQLCFPAVLWARRATGRDHSYLEPCCIHPQNPAPVGAE